MKEIILSIIIGIPFRLSYRLRLILEKGVARIDLLTKIIVTSTSLGLAAWMWFQSSHYYDAIPGLVIGWLFGWVALIGICLSLFFLEKLTDIALSFCALVAELFNWVLPGDEVGE